MHPPRIPVPAPLLLAICLGLAGCSPALQGGAPQRSGTLALPGLVAPVEIVRDRYGIPHIRAGNDHDLSFAQGVVHAQDRLFQMDTERRLARGELAEIFGEKTLPADRLFRHLGFAARAPALAASWPPSTRETVRAYCDGVNAAMTALAAWPAEFRLLGNPPRRFTPEDVAAVSFLKSFGLSQWYEEAVLYRVAQRLPPEKAEELMPRRSSGGPPAAAASVAVLPAPALLLEGLAAARRAGADVPRAGASNAWAVSGKKSVTGKPLLASDPHLMLSCPSLWYEVHLTAPGVDVYGVSFPGAPGVVIGHNPRVAWGLTNAMLDDADFFVETVDGDRVMSRKRWVPMTRREERIRIRGGREETVTVWETPHGPILSPVLPGVSAALSFRWAGYDGGDPLGVLHRLDRARNREEFLSAVSEYRHPAQNIVYADASGRIGVVMAGRIPVRKGGAGLLPVPGGTGEWDWKGYLPFSENPQSWDPPEGFVAAANFGPPGPDRGHYLSRLYEPPDRGRRIAHVLGGGDMASEETFERLQADVTRAEAKGAVALALRAAGKRGGDIPQLTEAARILRGWNLDASGDSAGAALYEVYFIRLVENLFRDDLGPDLAAELARTPRLVWNAVDRIIERGDSPFLDNTAAGRRETLEDLAARSLDEAMTFLKDRLGTVTATWSWGRIHRVTFEHPLGRVRYLRRFFDIGPFGLGGDGRTVNKQEFELGGDDDAFAVLVGPSMRQVVPLGFRQRARSVIATGASGLFFEKHYRDQAPLWLQGRTHPAWTAAADIDANAESRLRLIPKGAGGRR